MTELEKKEIEWLKKHSDGRKELRRKSQEQGSLPDYANFDLAFWKEIYREGKEAGAKENESEIEILQKQKSKLIDMVKQLMSHEIPNTDIDYLYQQECFKAAKKLLEELK